MGKVWLQRLATAVAAASLLLIVEGAIGVSAEAQPSILHRSLGAFAGAGAVAVTISQRRDSPKLALGLGLTAFGATLAGGAAEVSTLQLAGSTLHAVLGHLLFALTAVAAFLTSRTGAGARVEDGGWPSLRALAWLAPATLVLQIVLGAGYRHQTMGVIPHITGAFLAAVVALMAGSFVLTLPEATRTLRFWAVTLLGLIVVQILLGVAAYIARVADHSQLVLLTVLHVGTGALTLAASCILSASILREVVTVRRLESESELAGSRRNG